MRYDYPFQTRRLGAIILAFNIIAFKVSKAVSSVGFSRSSTTVALSMTHWQPNIQLQIPKLSWAVFPRLGPDAALFLLLPVLGL